MSLKLDGLLDAEDERHLDAHITRCHDCAQLWAAMQEADSLLWTSAREAVPLPVNFQANVMSLVAATPVLRPQMEALPEATPAVALPEGASVIPSLTRWLDEEAPAYHLDTLQEWHARIASYVRGMAVVGLSVAAAVGLLLAFVLSDVIQVSGPMSDLVKMLRTFFQATQTWVASLFEGFGPATVTVVGLVLGLLALAGWQLVSNYHRAASEQRANTGYLEALT
ncbi:MAG: zf-HC2 domain-containing protein [Chloroflexi bacterium]|nr:zf-HC2 domain-containing protein [Chloroflexota bacterium]